MECGLWLQVQGGKLRHVMCLLMVGQEQIPISRCRGIYGPPGATSLWPLRVSRADFLMMAILAGVR